MRLATCVALEFGVLAGIASAACAGAAWAMDSYAPTSASFVEASDGSRSLSIRESAFESPRYEIPDPLAGGTFEGQRDAELLAPLRTGAIKRVKFNRGGSSISLRIDFDNGARAAFKPEQTNYQTVPRKEIAAFRINRLLGLSTVQPAIGRAFSVRELYGALDKRSRSILPRLRAEVVSRDGKIAGELSWWIPVIKRAKIRGYAIDSTDGIVTWKRMLNVGAPIDSKDRPMVIQISNMLLFDYLINNPDRWSGGNARASEDSTRLYFMDNTMSFSAHPRGHRRVRTYLQRSKRFSRSLVQRVRDLTPDEVRDALADDTGPFPYLLSESEIKAFWDRHKRGLRYIDKLIKTHGEEAVLAFP